MIHAFLMSHVLLAVTMYSAICVMAFPVLFLIGFGIHYWRSHR